MIHQAPLLRRITELEAEVEALHEAAFAANRSEPYDYTTWRVTEVYELVEALRAEESRQRGFADHSAGEVDALMEKRRELQGEVEALRKEKETIAKISWVDVGLAWMRANRLGPHMSLEKLHNLSKAIVAELAATREASDS